MASNLFPNFGHFEKPSILMRTPNIAMSFAVILFLLAVAAPVEAGPYVDAVLADDPVGYWRLEEGSGTAVDSATGGNNGQGSQNGTYTDSPGQTAGPIRAESSNLAANFTGNNGYVDIPDSGGLFNTYVDPAVGGNPWSFEFWIINGAGGDPLVKGAHCCVTYFHHNGSGGGLRWGILSAGPTTAAVDFDDEPLGEGIWTHVVGIISNNEDGFSTDTRVYVNGDLVPGSDVVLTFGVPDDDSDLFGEPLTIGALAFNGGTYGNFFSGAIDEVAIYNYALDDPNEIGARDNTRIQAHIDAAGVEVPGDGSWRAGVSGDWNAGTNWIGPVPNANDALAIFGDSIFAPATVFSDTQVTAGSVTFDNSNEYVIMGNGGLTLEADTGSALVDVQDGSHRFQLPVTLADATTVNVEAGTTLTFNGDVNLGVHDLTTQGAGTVTFDHRVSSEGGVISLSGSSLAGSGSIEGDLSITDGGLVVQQNGLTVSGDVSIVGSLEIALVDGFNPTPGESFDILTAANIDVDGLDLRAAVGYALAVVDNGHGGEALQLTILVPEPTACFLACLTVMGTFFMRKKALRVVVPMLLVGFLAIGHAQTVQAQEPVVTYSEAVLADNPAGYWRFEEQPVNGATATDSSPNGRDGTYVGPLWSQISGVPGIRGNAVNRGPGTSSWVAVPATDDAAFGSTSLSFEAWLNAPNMSCTGACPGNYMVRGAWISTDTANEGVSATFAQHSGGNINASVNGGCCGQQVTSIPYPAPVPGWHHVVHTFTDNGDATTSIAIYVDGAPVGPTVLVDAGPAGNNVARDDSDFGLAIGILPFAGDNTENVVYANPIQGFTGGYDEFAYYDYALTPLQVATHFAASAGVPPEIGEWLSGASENWQTATNWFAQEIPDTDTEVAIFGGAIAEPRSVYLESDVTVKGVKFDNENAYAIGGNGGVVFSSADTSTVEVVQGSHQFQGSVQMVAPTTVTVAADSAVTFNGALSLTSALTKEGPGTLNVNSLVNAGGGSGIVVSAGTLGGSGEVDGNVTNMATGTVAPGNSPGILTVDGNFTQASGGTLEIEIGGLIAGDNHDQLDVLGSLDLDGTLMVSLIDDFAPVLGNTFDILNFTSATLQPGLNIVLPDGMWDTSMLGTTGELTFGDSPISPPDGDFNLSGLVDAQDLNLALFNWSMNGSELPTEWMHMRPADDVAVGVAELNKVLFTWNETGGLTAAVPEPATTILLAVGLLGCFGCFRNNQG